MVCLDTRAEHIRQCVECRTYCYVWYLRQKGAEPIPPDRTDPWRVKIRRWWSR